MNPSLLPAARRRQPPRAFALVITLLILAVLMLVALSFLSSMISERQTADAYTSRARAEQAAQTGADSAMAILRSAFKSYPDSATAWDVQQAKNDNASGTPGDLTKDGYTRGTSLYLRAQSRVVDGVTVPNPSPTADPNGALVDNRPPVLKPPAAAPSSETFDKRQHFVLPLISGIAKGHARLVTEAAASMPVLNVSETRPALQNFVNLNTRRFQGDTEGWLGSPPGHADKDANNKPCPTPVRVPWVEVKDGDGRVYARYGFWVLDESFKTNVSFAELGNNSERADNLQNKTANNPTNPKAPVSSILTAANLDLRGPLGLLTKVPTDLTAVAPNARRIFDVRTSYPNSLFPEPLAFVHAAGLTTPTYTDISGDPDKSLARYVDQIAYLTTTHSGGLNLSRHGSQRLNLNSKSVVDKDASPDTTNKTARDNMQNEVDRLVQTLRFHAPALGERFYRTSAGTDANTLNQIQVGTSTSQGGPTYRANFYFCKVAANIRDYLTATAQPTLVKTDGSIYTYYTLPDRAPATGSPVPIYIGFANLNQSPNPLAAFGKKAMPFLQETAVRFRGKITANRYNLKLDYYMEFWNMSNRRIWARARPAGDNSNDVMFGAAAAYAQEHHQ